ncbi:hypothetical protein ACN9MH_21770 [Paenibacillus silvae]|uniref:hypothetical protein n=1 Tax=Paenibacillus silvae TaxID=1325358 RepID=UPI003CEFA595
MLESTVDISEDIKRIVNMTKGRTSHKKLILIQEYMRSQHNLNWNLESIEDLEEKLNEANIDPDIVFEIYELLDQSFSQGYPFFVYELSLLNNVTEANLKESIEKCFKFNVECTPSLKSYTYLKRISEIEHIQGDSMRFSVVYEQFEEKPIRGGGIEKGKSEEKTTFEVFFDFKFSLCYFKSGDKKHVLCVQRYLSRNISSLSLISFSLPTKLKEVTFLGDIPMDKQTALILDFLEEQLEVNEFLINDYFSITFENRKSTKVKAVRLSGSNLFESYEVAERMKYQDKIKSVKLQLVKQKKRLDGNVSVVLSAVRIDFPSTFKVVFSEMPNSVYYREFIQHIISSMKKSISKEHSASEIELRMARLIRLAEVKDSYIVQRTLNEIKDKIDKLTLEESSKDAVLRLLTEYMPVR